MKVLKAALFAGAGLLVVTAALGVGSAFAQGQEEITVTMSEEMLAECEGDLGLTGEICACLLTQVAIDTGVTDFVVGDLTELTSDEYYGGEALDMCIEANP